MGLETIENMKNMEDTEMMEDNDLKHSICQRDDSKHCFMAFLARVKKIITNAFGEHDPVSAQNDCTSGHQ